MYCLIQKWAIRLMVLGLMVIGTALLSSSPQLIYAQDNLSPGDIAFVEYNADGTDNFKFVTLVDISASTVISFTDNGWLASGSFRATEGIISWTAPAGGVTAGTVINIDTTPSASVGSVSETGALNFSGSGDQIIAYQGSSTMIAALNNEGAATWQADATNSNTSALPQGLTNGTNAVAINEIDNVAYSGTTSGDKATLLAALNNPANWTNGSNSTRQTFSGVFTISTPTTYNLQITEIMYNPASDEDDWEWVEIYNAGSTAIDLAGYVIDDNNSTAHPNANIASGNLAAGESAVLYNADDVTASDFTAAWGNIDLIPVTNWQAMGLNNGGDSVAIWDSFANYNGDNQAQANAIEQVVYTDDPPWPADDGSASIYLTNLAADNTDGSNWALSTNGAATPLFNAYTALNAGGNSGSDIGSPGTPAMQGQALPLAEGFDDCTLAGWQIISVDADQANTWSCSEQFSNVDVNGFGDSAPADEWLITPPLNMNAQNNDRLTFRNYTNFTDANYPQLELLYSTDFSGDPTTATWTPLTGINFSPADSGQWVDSGEIDLSGISGTNVYFAFHYTSSGTTAGNAATWRVDEVNFFEGTPQGQPLPLAENFDDCTLAGWQIVSVDADQANTWSCSEQFSNVDVNGFGDSAPADEWLITPPLNLDAQDNDTLTFRSFTRFTDANYPQLEVLYSTDYDGTSNPTSATWTELTGITYSPENSSTWTDSGKVDLSGISGNLVYFAFRYTSSGTSGGSAANWRVDAVNFFVDDSAPPVAAKIHEVQGAGSSVTNPGTQVTVEGVVIGDYQGSDELSGFFIQEEDSDADADPNTSEGIFVFCGSCAVDVTEGQIVQVTGVQEEFVNMSQLNVPAATNGDVTIVNAGNNLNLVTPASVNLPAPASTTAENTFEQYEGMLVEFVDDLTVTEYFELARYGQIVLSEGGKLRQFTNDNLPDAAGYTAHLEDIAKRRIILDDLNNTQNDTDPVYHPQPGGFSSSNFIRGGYTVSNLTGVMHWAWAGQSGTNAWRIRPQITNPVTFTPSNPRQATPDDVGGDIKVATLNVLNYFTTIDLTESRDFGDCGPSATLDCRGADSNVELQRQLDKLVVALQAMDADIFALVELENNAAAAPAGDGVDPVLESIVNALNNVVGAGTYTFVDAGTIGTDAIKVGYIYKASTVATFGNFAVLDSNDFVDANNTGRPRNRPALAQTFQVIDTNNPSFGEKFTAVVNHLKSKGSGCGAGDDDTTTGQGNCNVTRTKAAEKLVDWLATDPTNSGDPDFMILGDINAYAMEDPIQAIKAGADDTVGTGDDFTNLISLFSGPNAYSFVFSGQWGYLDHVLANGSMTAQVTGLTEWHINADEVNLLDYNDDIQDVGERSFEAKPGVNPLYSPDQYRVSDHDPVIVGLALQGSEPVVVNNNLDNTNISTSYDPTPVANAPAGVFTLSATFTNITSDTLKNIYFEVAQLTGGNLLLNADGGPGGVSSRLSVPLDTTGQDSDLVLSPGEAFTIDFEIGLQQRRAFDFFVDAYGIVIDGVALTALSADNLASFTFEIEEAQLTPSAGGDQDIYMPLIIK